MVFHQVFYTTDLRHSILLIKKKCVLECSFLMVCSIVDWGLLKNRKEYDVCNVNEDDQYTAKDLEERWQIKNTQDWFPSWWVNIIRIMFEWECFMMYATYRIIINMVILYKDGHSRIFFLRNLNYLVVFGIKQIFEHLMKLLIVDEATYQVFRQNVTTYLLLIS